MTAETQTIARALCDVFGLEPGAPAVGRLQAAVTLHDLEAGAVLMRQGAPSDALYVLLRGLLLVQADNGDGPRDIGEIRRGETIGETGLVLQTPRNATVTAVRRSQVARIGAETFERVLADTPQLALVIARTLIARDRRNAGPRHPGHVPEILTLVAVSPKVDLAALAEALAGAMPGRTAVLPPHTDTRAGLAALRAAEAAHDRVLILCAADAPDWTQTAVAESDEILRVAEATRPPGLSAADAALEALAQGALPRQTLILLHPAQTRSPQGTARWLQGRRVHRHLHLRPDHPEDLGRVARILSGRAVGLVLAGGGARGAAHLGAIRALDEAGIRPDMVGGTSIGAAMAAWYAMGLRGESLATAARKVFVDSGGPTNDWTLLPLLSLVKGAKTRALSQQAIRDATGADIGIEDTWTPFFCIAANYTTQEQVVLRHGPLWQALTATYAIPGVLPPVLMNGGLHVDGGVVNNLPVDVMEASGAAHTIAVDLMPKGHRRIELEALPSRPALLLDKLRPRRKRRYRLPGLLSILLNSTVLSALERQREMRDRADLCLRPELQRIGLLDWKKFNAGIDQGYASVSAQLARTDAGTMALLRTVG